MSGSCLNVIDRMQFPVRTFVVAALLALGSPAVHAQTKAAGIAPATRSATAQSPAKPATTQPSSSFDFPVQPASTRASAPGVQALPAGHPTSARVNPLLPATFSGQGELRPRPATESLSAHDDAMTPGTATTTVAWSGPLDMPVTAASAEVQRVAHWISETRDNTGLPYLLIDKVNARVFAFDRAGRLQGSTPALLGMAHGDRLLAPNSATMEQMPPKVRITPAGRFVSKLAIDSHGKELLVLDYDASISLHAVVKGTPEERRAERLDSATADDNRISFGCINVPTDFYSAVVSPSFTGTKGVVYVLPETSPASALFKMDPVGAALAGTQTVSSASDAPAASAGAAPAAR
jgi:hypothetical protein